MTKIQRKIYEANLALQYFILNDWEFKNDKLMGLSKTIRYEDLRAFDVENCFNYDILTYMRTNMMGVKKYLLKDDSKNDEFNKTKYKILKIVHTILCSIPYIFLYYLISIKYGWIRVSFN
jgi:fatty acyl-CoA reductase